MPRKIRWMAPWLGFCLGMVGSALAQIPLGEDFRLDQEGRVAGSEIAAGSDGFMVVWDNTYNPFGGYLSNVQGRRFSSLGEPLGETFIVNNITTGYFAQPSVGRANGGDFLVTWNDLDSDVFGRRLDARGQKLGAEIAIAGPNANGGTHRAIGLGERDFIVVWSTFETTNGGNLWGIQGRKVEGDGALGEVFQIAESTTGRTRRPDVAATPDGGFLVVWAESSSGGFPGYGLRSRRYTSAAQPVAESIEVQAQEIPELGVSLAMTEHGEGLATWVRSGNGINELHGRRLDAMGEALGDSFKITETELDNFSFSKVAATDGGFLVVWETAATLGSPEEIHLRWLPGSDMSPLPWGDEMTLNTSQNQFSRSPAVAADPAGTALVTWTASPGSELRGRLLDMPCLDGPSTLCLRDGRFKVSVQWQDGVSGGGRGQVAGRSGSSGAFSFFGPEHLEVLVKAVDGCDYNGHLWVFAAAATDLQLSLTVRDTHTGVLRQYESSLGRSMPQVLDTLAFVGACGAP